MSMQKDHQPRNIASPKPSDRVCFRFHSRAWKRAITEQHHNMLPIMVFAPFAFSFTFFHVHCAEMCVCVYVWGAVVYSGYLFWINKGCSAFHSRICKLPSNSVTRPSVCIYNKPWLLEIWKCLAYKDALQGKCVRFRIDAETENKWESAACLECLALVGQ